MRRFGGRNNESFLERASQKISKAPLFFWGAVGMVVVGLLGLLIALPSMFASKKDAEKVTATVVVYTANSVVPPQTEILQSMVTQRTLNQDEVPEGAILEIQKIIGHFTTVLLRNGVVFTSSVLSEARNDVRLPIVPGMVGFTMDVGKAESREKNLLPGTRADLLAVDKAGNYRDYLLQKNLVLINGGDIKNPASAKPASPYGMNTKELQRFVTLMIPKESALVILAARLEKDLVAIATGSDSAKYYSDEELQAMGFNVSAADTADCKQGATYIGGVRYCFDKNMIPRKPVE